MLEYVARYAPAGDEWLVEAVWQEGNVRDIALIAVFAREAPAQKLAHDLNRLKYI